MAVDIDAVRDEAILLLNAEDAATLTWWDEDELARYANDAAQALSVDNNLIANFHDEQTLTDGDADYDFPALHKGTIQIAVGTSVLRESTVREMEAEDPEWSTAVAEADAIPTHWVGNWKGIASFRVYPIPEANGEWSIVQIEHPEQIETGNLEADLPSVLGEYFLLSMVRDALRKETRGARPDVSGVIDEMLKPIQQIVSAYWGA